MSVERRRRCGFRKVGGLYLVSSGSGMACGRLPIPLGVCPVCSSGIKQTRGWTWVDVPGLVKNLPCKATPDYCASCPLALPELVGRAGLLWIGAQFYRTPAEFQAEAEEMGMSRRISAVPRDFKLGETWVLFAHPRAIPCDQCSPTLARLFASESADVSKLSAEVLEKTEKCEKCHGSKWIAGAFRLFRPERIEKIVTLSQSQDAAAMKELADKGITPVIVPDDDPDHKGSVYDRTDDEEPIIDGKARAAGESEATA
jgi:hypothetical protein